MSLGEFLRNEREQRGITIEQVASATKVGVRSLHALEAELFVELPAKPFIRGFVASYCRFIGLDPKEVLARFDAHISQKVTERPNREGGHSGYAFEKREGEQSRTVLMVGIFSFLLIGGGAMAFFKPSLHHHKKSHVEKLRAAYKDSQASPTPTSSVPTVVFGPQRNEPAKGLPSPRSQPPVGLASTVQPVQGVSMISSPLPTLLSTAATPDPQMSSSSEGAAQTHIAMGGQNPKDPLDSGLELKLEEIQHKVVFKVQEDTWVRYQLDQRPMRKFILRKGRTLVLRAINTVGVQFSKPEAVTFSYNRKGQTAMIETKNLHHLKGDATLFFPNELAEKIKEPFTSEKKLPKKIPSFPDPLSPISSPRP